MLLRLEQPSVADRVAALNTRYRHHSATAVLEHALNDPELGRVALVSSFGAESVVLLHLVSVLAPQTPVIFVDTRMLFQETHRAIEIVGANLHPRAVHAQQRRALTREPLELFNRQRLVSKRDLPRVVDQTVQPEVASLAVCARAATRW